VNTQSSTSSVEPQAATSAIATTQPFYWSVRRELWEYRSIYIAPLAVAGATLLGFLFATIGRSLSTRDLTQRMNFLTEPFSFATAVIMGTMFIVSIFYSVEALYSERRDRSILFWKSLPVSDATTVLSKAGVAILAIPFVGFVITVLTQLTMLALAAFVVTGSGMSMAEFWSKVSLPRMTAMQLYHLFTVHVLWYAPIYCWLLLVSGWARRAPFLWAVMPGIVIAVLEKIVFRSKHFVLFLKYRIRGPEHYDFSDYTMHYGFGNFLREPGLWLGLVVAAVFLFAAVKLRRYQQPI